jgi:hypothetical protein
MALTREFKELIGDQARNYPAFRKALLVEAATCMITGDFATGKAVLRNYINATIGFPGLAQAMNISATSLMRMLGATGNPTAAHIFGVLAELQKYEGLHFEVRALKQ